MTEARKIMDALYQAAKEAMPQDVRRIHCEAYLGRGFTQDQTLVLCKDCVKP